MIFFSETRISDGLDLTETFNRRRTNLPVIFRGAAKTRIFERSLLTLFSPGSLERHRRATSARMLLLTSGGQSLLVDLTRPRAYLQARLRDEPLLQANASPTIVMVAIARAGRWRKIFTPLRISSVGGRVIGDPPCCPMND